MEWINIKTGHSCVPPFSPSNKKSNVSLGGGGESEGRVNSSSCYTLQTIFYYETLLHATTHPWTMMIHPTDTAIAYPTMMTHGWLKRLTLSTHAMTGTFPSLLFHGHGTSRHGSWICQGCFGMTCQCHGA